MLKESDSRTKPKNTDLLVSYLQRFCCSLLFVEMFRSLIGYSVSDVSKEPSASVFTKKRCPKRENHLKPRMYNSLLFTKLI